MLVVREKDRVCVCVSKIAAAACWAAVLVCVGGGDPKRPCVWGSRGLFPALPDLHLGQETLSMLKKGATGAAHTSTYVCRAEGRNSYPTHPCKQSNPRKDLCCPRGSSMTRGWTMGTQTRLTDSRWSRSHLWVQEKSRFLKLVFGDWLCANVTG